MLGFGKKGKVYVDEDFIDLKETIWSLKTIAYTLQETAEEFESTLEELKLITHASPAYENKGKNNGGSR